MSTDRKIIKHTALLILLTCLHVTPSVRSQQDFDSVEIQVLPVRDNIYMLVGAGGNITLQLGDEGVLMVDTQFAPLSGKILAVIRELSDQPLRYIINTHYHYFLSLSLQLNAA